MVLPGCDSRTDCKAAGMGIGPVSQIDENMIVVDVVFLTNPAHALCPHMAEGLCLSVHPHGHVVTTNTGQCAGPFGNRCGRVVRTAGTKVRQPVRGQSDPDRDEVAQCIVCPCQCWTINLTWSLSRVPKSGTRGCPVMGLLSAKLRTLPFGQVIEEIPEGAFQDRAFLLKNQNALPASQGLAKRSLRQRPDGRE